MYSGCQIHWGSKIQTEISLSTTESNYIALSTSMWELITFMSLMKETAGLFGILTKDPVFRCALWKDNERCITVAKIPQFTPRAKHFAIKYHQFWCFLSNVKITMNSIGTTKQIADIFTNTLGEKSFCYLWHTLMGWKFKNIRTVTRGYSRCTVRHPKVSSVEFETLIPAFSLFENCLIEIS